MGRNVESLVTNTVANHLCAASIIPLCVTRWCQILYMHLDKLQPIRVGGVRWSREVISMVITVSLNLMQTSIMPNYSLEDVLYCLCPASEKKKAVLWKLRLQLKDEVLLNCIICTFIWNRRRKQGHFRRLWVGFDEASEPRRLSGESPGPESFSCCLPT